ncbi:hypothetical protein PT974_06672 [Cladobotryum mycophilum]|uniref:Clr5 domain-containing protein n=1 Tax=Cladobotryum mycophilum TaxID=491253 RepID=A0ABR0SMB0_9HYPO
MPATNSKANYKTYEAQARMVRAIVAAHPEVKWNYRDIVACYGSDITEHALNHRFRRLRSQSLIIREARRVGLDMKNLMGEADLPATQEGVDKKNIAKYFGQSTTDGIQFQFRTIKKDADRLRQVEQNGGDVANCLSLGTASGSVFSTPSKPTPVRGTGSRTGTGGGRKRTRIPEIKRTSSDEDEDDDDADDNDGGGGWSEREETPSKRPKVVGGGAGGAGAFPGQKNGTPSRRAAAKANVTIAEATAKLESTSSSSDEHQDFDTPTQHSVFALPPQTKPVIQRNDGGGIGGYRSSAFTRAGTDSYLTGGLNDNKSYENLYGDLGDGEI